MKECWWLVLWVLVCCSWKNVNGVVTTTSSGVGKNETCIYLVDGTTLLTVFKSDGTIYYQEDIDDTPEGMCVLIEYFNF